MLNKNDSFPDLEFAHYGAIRGAVNIYHFSMELLAEEDSLSPLITIHNRYQGSIQVTAKQTKTFRVRCRGFVPTFF